MDLWARAASIGAIMKERSKEKILAPFLSAKKGALRNFFVQVVMIAPIATTGGLIDLVFVWLRRKIKEKKEKEQG